MLDEKGKDVMSEQIADLIGDAGNTVCFVLWFFRIFANYMLLKFRLLEFPWENIRLDYIFSKCFRDHQGSHFVLVGHMVLGYKYESGQMQQLGYLRWF